MTVRDFGTIAPVLLALFANAACSGVSESDLFSGTRIADGGNGGPYGAGGQLAGTGGFPGMSGSGSTGGAPGGGGFVASGGFGSGGFTGSGGFAASGGFAGSGSGGFTASGGATNAGGSGDGGVNLALCDFTGTWGSYVVAPVTWPDAPFVIFGGSGNLQQWTLSHETKISATDVKTEVVPCGIYLPDLQSSVGGLFYKYGIRFPDSLFDASAIPTTTFVMKGGIRPQGSVGFTTDPFAILVGARLTNPTTDPWPAAQSVTTADDDLDGHPGVTVVPATGSGYSLPPTDAFYSDKAALIYIAERTIASLDGVVVSCDEVRAQVTIAGPNGSDGINSSVVGCQKQSGSDCTPTEANFIDSARPVFTPQGTGTLVSVRLSDNATCKDVRSRFPAQ
jgi:hypothetical protein